MIFSLHELVTIAVFINVVNCDDGDGDDDGSDGISIKKFREMDFTPCVVILVIEKNTAFPHFSLISFLGKKEFAL